MAEVLSFLASKSFENQSIQPLYQPEKPRLITNLDSSSRHEIQPLYDQLGASWNRTYGHVPGIAIATLRHPDELFPYMPDSAARARMAQSRFNAINQAEEDRFFTVRTEDLVVTSYEGVPVICLSLSRRDTEIVREQAEYSLSRTFELLTDGGTVVNRGLGWLSQVHDMSLSHIPLARFPSGQRKAAKKTMDAAAHLVPSTITVNITPRIYGDFEPLFEAFTDSVKNQSQIRPVVGRSVVERAFRAANEYPKAKVTLGVTAREQLGNVALADNLMVKVVERGGNFMKIQF